MKFKKLAAITAAAALCAAPFASGCQDSCETRRAIASYMNTDAILVLTADFSDDAVSAEADALWADIKTMLAEVEQSLSASIESSYINAFNTAAAGERVEVDEICYTVLSLGVDMYEATGGSYNPAVYYSVDLYGFAPRATDETMPYDRESYETLPDQKYITAFQQLSESFSDIIMESENGAYYVTKPAATVEVDGVEYSLKIDLGGIGKGYCVDLADELITDHGFEYGYFTFGSSSIAVKGSYESKNGDWSVSFRDPRGSVEDTYLSADVGNLCLSTSGDYEQYYELDGVRYCHIIDPATGSPVQTGVITATVVGGTAAEGDALTTALIAMGLERAVEYINACLTDKKVVLVYENSGSYFVITNDADFFTITNSAYTSGNTVDSEGRIVLNSNVG